MKTNASNLPDVTYIRRSLVYRVLNGRWQATLLLIVLQSLSNCATSTAGELVFHDFESTELAGNLLGTDPSMRVQVYVPDGYDQNQADYPVVYWFAGAGQGPTTGIEVEAIEQEFASGRALPSLIAFMPATASFGYAAYVNSDAFGNWQNFLTEEVIPFVDETYRTSGTSDQRAAMGYSLGGLSSMLLPLNAPGTFGAVGLNDPAISAISGMARSIDEVPEDFVVEEEQALMTIEQFFATFPEDLEGYKTAPRLAILYGQLAATLSPNPDSPLYGDLPFNADAMWLPEVRARWQEFDLLNPASIQLHIDALSELATISVILPEKERQSSAIWNEEMVHVMRDAGLPARGIASVGGHSDAHNERFTSLLSEVTFAMQNKTRTPFDDVVHTQDFDALGADVMGTELLPTGWSVAGELSFNSSNATSTKPVFRDRTNMDLGEEISEVVARSPYIFNVGESGSATEVDRGIGVYLDSKSPEATIQFSADVSEVPDVSGVKANAFRVAYDLKWFPDDEIVELPNELATLTLTASFDDVAGNESFAVFQSDVIEYDPQAPLTDGTRLSTSGFIPYATRANAETMRLQWNVVANEMAELGIRLDDVVIELLFLGDFDGDQQLNSLDIDQWDVAWQSGEVADPELDLNGDGVVDLVDRERWVSGLFGTTSGDVNLDRRVDFSDFLALSRNYNSEQATKWTDGDFDGDGQTSFSDFLLLSQNFNFDASTSAVTSVPEPTDLWVLLVVLASAACRMRRRSPSASVLADV